MRAAVLVKENTAVKRNATKERYCYARDLACSKSHALLSLSLFCVCVCVCVCVYACVRSYGHAVRRRVCV